MPFQFLVQTAGEEAMINVSLLKFFMPIFLFMFVFALMYAILKKTGLVGESPFALMVMAFVVAIVFVVTPAAFQFTKVITPWFVVFIISLLFIFMIFSWLDIFKPSGGGGGALANAVGNTWVAWIILIVILAIFIFAGIATFGPILSPTGGAEGTSGAEIIGFETKKILFHPAILGLALLFVIAAVTAWVLGSKS